MLGGRRDVGGVAEPAEEIREAGRDAERAARRVDEASLLVEAGAHERQSLRFRSPPFPGERGPEDKDEDEVDRQGELVAERHCHHYPNTRRPGRKLASVSIRCRQPNVVIFLRQPRCHGRKWLIRAGSETAFTPIFRAFASMTRRVMSPARNGRCADSAHPWSVTAQPHLRQEHNSPLPLPTPSGRGAHMLCEVDRKPPER